MPHEIDSKAIERVVEVLVGEGLDGMSRAFEILLNEAMKLDQSNRGIKRRIRVATLFPNEASVLGLVTAVVSEVSEVSEECAPGKVHLNMKSV